jgi:dipeptidyl aminopeptidase/acylaminoacyl peptidase
MTCRSLKRSTSWLWFVLLFVAVVSVPVHAQPAFSIEDVLSAPFPSALTTAPSGDRVAWVENVEGVRNIWTASGPDYNRRRVTSYNEDDGQRLGSLAFTPDGRRIVYVRGGYPNRRGVHPNPRSRPEPADRAIWIVDLDEGSPQRLAEGHSPVISPSGEVAAYLRNNQVWTVSLKDTSDSVPSKFFTIRGGAESLRWSPDGQKLAFVSDRGDHSFVGVYNRTTRRLRYPDPGVDKDRDPAWGPDGNRLAFVRVPHEEDPAYAPDRTAQPWSIRVVNLDKNEARTVWKADPGQGSAFQYIQAENQIFWGAGDHIVFPWEKTGWRQLYSVPVEGGDAEALTSGAFEVQFVTMTPDRKEIVYVSNQNDMHRRHLWRVSVQEGPPTQITSGSGIEWGPAVTAKSEAVAFLASGARTPAHAEVKPAGADRRSLRPRNSLGAFPSEQLVTPEPVSFPASDGKQVHGQLFLPPGGQSTDDRPAILFFHGGPMRQMLLGFHYRGYYHNAYSLNQYLASQGYVVLSVNYRGGIGYGLDFREARDYGPRGASEYRDVIGAGLYLQDRPEVDPDRIGLWGGSYGGYLTALGLARGSDLFASGVDLHGVHDWTAIRGNIAEGYPPAKQPAARQRAFEASPMADVEDWTSPVLLIHGDDDRNVPFSETVDLVNALRTYDVPHDLLVFPDEVHGFLLHENWLRAYRATAAHFDQTLGVEE